MKQYIYDKTTSIWYKRDGDYYIPCLTLPEVNIGLWGERRLNYIRENKKLLHTKLLLNGTLYTHLAEINTRAEEMFSDLVNQMKKHHGITEQLKADNQLEWIRQMNNIRHSVNEIIYNEFIYT